MISTMYYVHMLTYTPVAKQKLASRQTLVSKSKGLPKDNIYSILYLIISNIDDSCKIKILLIVI